MVEWDCFYQTGRSLLVASRLVLRWAAQQPKKQAMPIYLKNPSPGLGPLRDPTRASSIATRREAGFLEFFDTYPGRSQMRLFS
jgi:hypothetical protein